MVSCQLPSKDISRIPALSLLAILYASDRVLAVSQCSYLGQPTVRQAHHERNPPRLDAHERRHDAAGRLPAHPCTTIRGRLFAGKPIGKT